MTVATHPLVDHRLLDELRRAVGSQVAVERALRDRWDDLETLAGEEATGTGPSSRIVHAEPSGTAEPAEMTGSARPGASLRRVRGEAFSVVVLTLPPGAATSAHDHLTWCTVAVVRGDEHETTYLDPGTGLEVVAESINPVGSITSLYPPGDIHRVRNVGTSTAVSVHVYGADLSRAGSSVRRTYGLPVELSPGESRH